MSSKLGLVARVLSSMAWLPVVKVDDENRTFEIKEEGVFFNFATEVRYMFKGYKRKTNEYVGVD